MAGRAPNQIWTWDCQFSVRPLLLVFRNMRPLAAASKCKWLAAACRHSVELLLDITQRTGLDGRTWTERALEKTREGKVVAHLCPQSRTERPWVAQGRIERRELGDQQRHVHLVPPSSSDDWSWWGQDLDPSYLAVHLLGCAPARMH